MWQDFWFALRAIRRNPGFTTLAILCLTVGIGATTAVFSWIEGSLLRPYALVSAQGRLLVISGTAPAAMKGTDISWPDFLHFRKNCTLIDTFIAEKIVGTTLSTGGERAARVPGSVVSANYFDALGIHPILGRAFEPIDETGRNAHPVVVISYRLWQEHFHGDPAIIGRAQVLNGFPHTIIGVAPQGFYGTFVGYAFQFWVPVSMQETFDPGGYKLEDRGAQWIEGFVRLKPGVTGAQAQNEISAVASQLEREYPKTNRARGIRLVPLWRSPFNPMEVLAPALSTALLVASAVLLIACANVGNLLLLKGVQRRRELTIRLAVGAGRFRVVKLLLAESLIISALAAVGGLIVAHWLRNSLTFLFPPRGGVLLQLPAQLDWRVAALSAGVCLISTTLFGLTPAILTSKVNLLDALKSDSSGIAGGRNKAWVRSGLVVVQISLSFVLLVGGGLVMHSQERMRSASPGFSTEGVLTTSIDLVAAGYNLQRGLTFEDELLDRIRNIDGVQSAAFARTIPFSYRPYSSVSIKVDGYEAPPDAAPTVDFNEVGPNYFTTTGIPLLLGREFTKGDNEVSAPVAVVNATMAERYWPRQNPIGKQIQANGRSMLIVGVVKDSKYRTLLEPARPFFYVPLRQNALGQNLSIRTSLPLQALSKALVNEIHSIDPGLAPSEIITMREQVDRTASPQTLAVSLLGVFSGVALGLSVIGLYGVISFSVAQGSREVGLRMALGASRLGLFRFVMQKGLAVTAAGIALGGVAAFESTRLMGYLLYETSAREPFVFAASAVIMTVASSLACLLPSWRAMNMDPMLAFKT